ncbi:MAG TPA: BamA/TamA family outer membrane protein [Chitinophagaceae bacterium]|jgi:outer membrane protein assembly factor BamA|nr:BamA/TamA family outer membrane protein [Chitinophagaceae bacterium]
MTPGRPLSISCLRHFIAGASWLILASSCMIVKNYPPNKPFVYKTNINITGNIASDTAELIQTRLKGQLDDSIRARSVSKIFWSVMKNPPVYNSDNADKSVIYMKALLNSLGYFKDTIRVDTVVNRKGDQYRTTVTFDVKPGKVVRIDSFNYNLQQQELQSIALANQKDAIVKKGDPFAKVAISAEMDRLVELYRNNGYLRFGREVMIGLWDTLDVSLLRPTFDPVEQLAILQKLRERRENPTANLEIRLRPGFDSSKLTKYYTGNITVYPEYGPDTVGYTRQEEIVDGINVVYYQRMFKPKILPENIFFRTGDLYDQRKYFKTINRFNSLGAWRLVSIEPVARKGQDTADYVLRLTPAKKYSFTANLEGSRNQSAISGNLFGIGVNLGWQNRNFGRAANISTTNMRYGIEISDSSFIQTQQFVLSHNIYFPRLIPRFRLGKKIRENTNTILSFNAGNTERKDLFNLTTLNGSFGWEYQDSNKIFSLRLLNIEYSYLKPRQKLIDLFTANPALKNVFTDGLISSIIAGVTINNDKEKVKKIFRANAELSGLVSGFIRSKFLDDNLYRFIKLDAEMIRKMIMRRSALVLRAFGGVGYEFNSTVNPNKRNNLPFFKQYFAGGPNSMRAWGLRKLGPGSDTLAFSGVGSTPERYGDVQLEGNIEYRFPLAKPFGIKVDGAVFTDIGNIWFLKGAPGRSDSQVFHINNLARDLAVGIGVGFRVDFNFFVIRLDYSYKAKDPSPSPANVGLRNKWFGYSLLKGDQFQLGISYPFIL